MRRCGKPSTVPSGGPRIESTASGELEGTGLWTFSKEGPATRVRYDWNVRTTRPWMNALAPVARPFFRWPAIIGIWTVPLWVSWGEKQYEDEKSVIRLSFRCHLFPLAWNWSRERRKGKEPMPMTHRQRALAQPQGRNRAKPGTAGGGKYFRIVTRPKEDFVAFRTQDVGGPGHALRLAGKRRSGSWDTQAWLISKEEAHTQGNRLVPETPAVKRILKNLGSAPVHVKADLFQARPRRDIPESEKPTPAQRRAQIRNIRKAQAARRQHQKAA